jgi:type IV pilus assembly protein PilW
MNPQRGAGLAELMVALAVGMLAMLLAAGLLVTASAAYSAQIERSAVDDGGRYAIEIMTRAARQAAFVNWERDEAGFDLAGAVNGSDVLALRFAGSGPAPDGDGSVISCAGFGVSAHDEGWSIFYVARNADGEAELRCKYRGKTSWSADAVIGGVDTFQVLYGLDTDQPADGVANQYVSASVLNALDAALVLTGADQDARERERRRRTHWKRVASIRVALLVHGARRTRGAGERPEVFDLFGRAYSDSLGGADPGVRLSEDELPDELRRRERRLFSSTIALRNSPGEAR